MSDCGTITKNKPFPRFVVRSKKGCLALLKSFFYGVVMFLFILFSAIVAGDLKMAMSFAGGLGLVCLVLSGAFSRAFVHDQSAEETDEPEKEKHMRWKWTVRTCLFALPNLAGAAAVFLYLTGPNAL